MKTWLQGILIVSLVLPALLLPRPARAAIDSFFDVFSEVPVVGPPYPTAPVVTIVGSFSGPLTTYERVSISLAYLERQNLPGPWPGMIQGHDSGGGGGAYGIDSFFDIFLDVPVATSTPQDGLVMKSRVSVVDEIVASGLPSTLVVRHPESPPEDPARYFDVTMVSSFFDIYFSVDCGCGVLDYHLHGSTPNFDISFLTLNIERDLVHGVQSFFDIYLEVSIGAAFNPTAPAWTVQTNATFTEHPTPVQPITWSGIKALLDS